MEILYYNFEILKTWNKGRNIKLEVSIDTDMISQIAQNINNSIDDAVVQPSYYIEKDNSKLIVTSGKEGVKVDEKQLIEEIYKVLDENTEDEQKIEIPVIKATPEKIDIEKIHEEVYKEVQDAYYTKDPFTIHPEEDGIDFDVEAAKSMLLEEKAEYEIFAKEDTYTQDNQKTLIYSKDEKIVKVTTNENGEAIIQNLPQGKYYIKQKINSYGFSSSNEENKVEISYQGQ